MFIFLPIAQHYALLSSKRLQYTDFINKRRYVFTNTYLLLLVKQFYRYVLVNTYLLLLVFYLITMSFGIPWKQMTVLTDAFDIQLLYSCNTLIQFDMILQTCPDLSQYTGSSLNAIFEARKNSH